MNKKNTKTKGVAKGASSGFMISLLVHAGAIALAGMLVVFTVQQKEEKKFVPPKPVDRPKMKLKKPKVKVKKSAKPKSANRIVTKVKRANMPDIQLPEMSGVGQGFGDGVVGGFDLVPDLEEVSMFGGEMSIGNDLEGTLYDLKRLRTGRVSGIYENEGIIDAVEKFISSGWKASALNRFYRSPKKLYSPMIMVPPTDSSLGPWAFGERDMDPWAFLLHYKGKLIHPDGIKFRFVTMGDNYLVIRVNGKVVLDYKNQFQTVVPGAASQPLNYHLGHWWAYGSEWIELEAGVPQDVEFILGDYKGFLFASMVAVEEYGVDYPTAPLPMDNPQLPIFKTAALSLDQVHAVQKEMWDGHLNLTSGPVFSDYDDGKTVVAEGVKSSESVEPVAPESEQTKLRAWSLKSGKSLEAEYLSLFSGKAVLKTAGEDIIKVDLSDLSAEDLDFIELKNPPKLKLSFKKNTEQFTVKSNPDLDVPVPAAVDFAGGVVVKQDDRKADYQRPLKLEFYVVADSYDGDDFILHDRQIADFTLTPENERTFELTGRMDTMLRYEHYSGSVRGERFKGYMILVFNENDELIAQELSHDWLLDLRGKLKDFPVGRYFNKDGERVAPPRPTFTDRYWDAEP